MDARTLVRSGARGICIGLAACGSSEVAAPPLVVVDVPPAGSASTGLQIAELRPLRTDPNCCKGKNECKGLGNCRSATGEGCRGKNECKGKGGCRPSVCPGQQREGACCKGLNECKGKGGCKTDGNDCKGLNECKGKGGCRSRADDC